MMKPIFKDDLLLFFIDADEVDYNYISNFDFDISEVPDLNNIKPLYHYRCIKDNTLYPVYYEYKKRFITKYEDYPLHTVFSIENTLIKDYTIPNLKLL